MLNKMYINIDGTWKKTVRDKPFWQKRKEEKFKNKDGKKIK